MDLPQPPQDTELRNIIDKLAQFVARNGPEFEQMTKTKQKGNPKFQFLFGGEFFNYYQYKVTSEQAVFKQQQTPTPPQIDSNQNSNWNATNNTIQSSELDHINVQQETLREQIKQSEQNLSAQHAVLLQQQQAQVEVLVAKCEADSLQQEANDCDVKLADIYTILQPIIDSCTKDSISNGKSWFLQHATNKEQALCIVHCLLSKVINATVFSEKLHIIYLVNDLLHHCARKNATELKEALESVVVPMFCNAQLNATEDQRAKLEKLLKLWESKANYLDRNTVEKMRQAGQSYQSYKSDTIMKYSAEIALLAQQTKATYDSYQSQHQAFVCHAMQQINDLQQQKQMLEQQKQMLGTQKQLLEQPKPSPQANIIPLETIQASLQQTIQNLSQQNNNTTPNNNSFNNTQPNDYLQMDPSVPPPNLSAVIPTVIPAHPPPTQPPQQNLNSNGMENPFSLPPPGFFPPPGFLPDFSRPPPGFPLPPQEAQLQLQQPAQLVPPTAAAAVVPLLEDLMPTAPYYDLPAGLMVPLIKLEDTTYKPLDPKDIRLPPPAPPSDRLLAAVEAFYSLPSHERPRDSEGWEKLGLYEYYKAKNNAKREKEEQIAAGLREKSRTPSPVALPVERALQSPPRRRYTSRSPTSSPPPPSHVNSAAAVTTPSTGAHTKRRGSRSRSRSPVLAKNTPRRRRSKGSRSSRRSVSRSSSRSPPSQTNRRSTSVSPPKISFSRSDSKHQQELDASNKGHQMLRKMGWGGSGLGANEQGIDAPISGGDVRDRQDQFKGVGCNMNDPYENFRKNKGAAFITRMKARAEERAHESKLLDY